MKKRVIAFFLIIMLLLPELAMAGVSAKLNQKMATRSGPGTKYTEELGTMPITTDITVIAQVETGGTVWYQVEFRYNSMLYRAYTGKKRVNAYGTIPWQENDYTSDTTISSVKPYYGPGEGYAQRSKGVSSGTSVRVYGVEGDWAMCDYKEGKRWVRAYINVNDLENTVSVPVTATPAATATPAPKAETQKTKVISNILDYEQKICVDYYGNEYSYMGHDEEFAYMVGKLPVMSYFDRVPCIRSHTEVYSGPGTYYWRRWNSNGSGYSYTGKLDKNLRIYGKENGWIMIRYPSDANGGFRYGWVIPAAISTENQARTPDVDFAYLEAITTQYTDATDDPDRSIQYVGTSISEHITVTALAFLDEDRNWVYCEYYVLEDGTTQIARGFIPADQLNLTE